MKNRFPFIRLLLTPLMLTLISFQSALAQNPDEVEMADLMRSNGKIYVVIGVLSIVFLGIIIYLMLIDRRLRKLERDTRKS